MSEAARPPAADEPVDDGALARCIATGRDTHRAETLLVERFARRVYLYGLRHLRDPARAEDLSQEVMTRVLERLRAGEVREPDRIGSFILGTARMVTHGDRRRQRRRHEVADRWAAEAPTRTDPVERADLDRLQACLHELPERDRAVVLLSFHGGKSAAEIGAAYGLEPGNVRVIRHRALTRLRRGMGLDGEEDR